MAVFTDDFTRSDADTWSSPWAEELGDWGIRSNRGRYIGDLTNPDEPDWAGINTEYPVLTTVDAGSGDMEVEWEAENLGWHTAYLVFRCVDENNTLLISGSVASKPVLRVERVVAGVRTIIGSWTAPGWRNERIKVRAVGTQITVYVAGVPLGTITESAHQTATRAGVGGTRVGYPAVEYTASAAFTDNFTRSDASTLGSPWTTFESSTWGIATNRANWQAGTGEIGAVVDLGSPFQTIEWDWTVLGNKALTYSIFGFEDSNNYWFITGLSAGADRIALYQRSGGTNTSKAGISGVTWGAGYRLKVETSPGPDGYGATIKVWSDGTLVLAPFHEGPPLGTKAGIGGFYWPGYLDLANTRWTRFYGKGNAGWWERRVGTGPSAYPPFLDRLKLKWFSAGPPNNGARHVGLVRGARG